MALKELKARWKSETPTFWKRVQKVGLALGAVGTVIITAPVSLPASLVAVGGYLVTAGGVTAALAQLTRR